MDIFALLPILGGKAFSRRFFRNVLYQVEVAFPSIPCLLKVYIVNVEFYEVLFSCINGNDLRVFLFNLLIGLNCID